MNETEMSIELRNGSLFQGLGADQPDRLRGPDRVLVEHHAEMKGAPLVV